MKLLLKAALVLGLTFLSASSFAECKGYAGPGGPCYAGPGGPEYAGPGGGAYSGPGGGGGCPRVCR